MKKEYSTKKFYSIALAVVFSVFAVVSAVTATSTISTNISTQGTLDVTGKTTLVNASTTRVSVGSSGTTVQQIIHGTCTSFTASTLATGDGISHAASTTKSYDCAVTGVVSGDVVIAQFATSTPNSAGSLFTQAVWSIVGAKASSTSGYISLLIWNNGPAAVPSAVGVGSSTNYIIIR
ncbi:MAG TPA: hypothetical protein VJJ28_02320 [Candidatus Paceibacterota bacterium]